MRTRYKFIEDLTHENFVVSTFYKYNEPGWLGWLFGAHPSMEVVAICFPTLGHVPFMSQSRYFDQTHHIYGDKVPESEITKMQCARNGSNEEITT